MGMTTTKIDIRTELSERLGLTQVQYQENLSKEELFHAAIANDRGRVREGGPDDEQKSRPTALGVDGPLVYMSDPTCTGRPVQDTFGVAWPEFEEKVWWKPDFKKFDPEKYTALLERVVAHLNEKQATLYVKDVTELTNEIYLAWLDAVRQGDPPPPEVAAEAEPRLRAAWAKAEELGLRWEALQARWFVGRCLAARGQARAAQPLFEAVRDGARKIHLMYLVEEADRALQGLDPAGR